MTVREVGLRGGVGEDLAAVGAALERFVSRPRDARPGEGVRGEMVGWRRLMDRMELEFSGMVTELAAGVEVEWLGHNSPTDWVKEECHLTGTAAWNALVVGEQAARMPETTSATGRRAARLISPTWSSVRTPPSEAWWRGVRRYAVRSRESSLAQRRVRLLLPDQTLKSPNPVSLIRGRSVARRPARSGFSGNVRDRRVEAGGSDQAGCESARAALAGAGRRCPRREPR